jgi:hypothetical protein
MKFIVFGALIVFSSTGFSSQYLCNGKYDSFTQGSLSLDFPSNQDVKVTDAQNQQYDLPFDSQNANTTITAFTRYGQDDYGSYVSLVLPAKVEVSGPGAFREFPAQWRYEIYSEEGHVNTVTFDGLCYLKQ